MVFFLHTTTQNVAWPAGRHGHDKQGQAQPSPSGPTIHVRPDKPCEAIPVKLDNPRQPINNSRTRSRKVIIGCCDVRSPVKCTLTRSKSTVFKCLPVKAAVVTAAITA